MTDKEKIMGKKELKTNAMRILDRYKIPYEYQTYECGEFVDGITIAVSYTHLADAVLSGGGRHHRGEGYHRRGISGRRKGVSDSQYAGNAASEVRGGQTLSLIHIWTDNMNGSTTLLDREF